MLVLSRNIDQKIIITVGNEIITIEVLDIIKDKQYGRRAKLGITASDNVTIDREEIYEDKYKCKEILTKKSKYPIVKFNNEK